MLGLYLFPLKRNLPDKLHCIKILMKYSNQESGGRSYSKNASDVKVLCCLPTVFNKNSCHVLETLTFPQSIIFYKQADKF